MGKQFKHVLDSEVQGGYEVNGRTYWGPVLPYPYFTTKGLLPWKRFNEKNWRPLCGCGKIFNDMEAYEQHYFREAQEL